MYSHERDFFMSPVIRFIRYILFCLFFSVGTGAIVLSILVGEIDEYYANKDALVLSEEGNEKLRKFNTEYDLQLEQAEKDPDIIERLKHVTLGEQFESDDTVYPTATREAIAQAEAVIASGIATPPHDDPLRKVVDRCMELRIRLSLFVAGAGLVLLTFLFFGKKRPPRKRKDIRFESVSS